MDCIVFYYNNSVIFVIYLEAGGLWVLATDKDVSFASLSYLNYCMNCNRGYEVGEKSTWKDMARPLPSSETLRAIQKSRIL